MAEHRVVIEPAAWKQLMKLAPALQERLLQAIEELEHNPRPSGCKKLQGSSDLYRVRAGDYRVVYQVRDEVLLVLVVKVAHRRDVYE